MSPERRVTPSDPEWGVGRSRRSTGYRSRAFYLPDDLFFRLRNAAWHTQTETEGYDSISELVAEVLRPEIEFLEQKYNDGQPFPEIPEGRSPRAGPSGRARQAEAVRRLSARRRDPDEAQADAAANPSGAADPSGAGDPAADDE